MFNNIIFLLFRNNYRFFALGNFAKSKKYLNIKVILLGGKFKSLIGILLYYLNIGKFISIDGNPFLKNRKNSINVWFGGTRLKISKKYRSFDNNFVNMSNPIIGAEKKIFQIYPVIYKKKNFYKKPKIIFMGKVFFKPNEILTKSKFLDLNKKNFLQNFGLIDDKNFWDDNFKNYNIEQVFETYKMIKTYLRELIILSIDKNFKNYFFIYGEDKKNIGVDFFKPVYENKRVKKIYEGNICIDTGSVLGSLSLHPRSIQILESNGLLIQVKQNDALKIWGNLNEKIIFNNMNNLLRELDQLLSDSNKFNDYLNLIYEKFEKSENKNANLLLNIFK